MEGQTDKFNPRGITSPSSREQNSPLGDNLKNGPQRLFTRRLFWGPVSQFFRKHKSIIGLNRTILRSEHFKNYSRCIVIRHHTSHVTRHTSHVTRHTSHVTRHTSYATRHTSHVIRHTSHITRHTPHVTRHRSHVTRHTPSRNNN
jgi:hypothetical protein